MEYEQRGFDSDYTNQEDVEWDDEDDELQDEAEWDDKDDELQDDDWDDNTDAYEDDDWEARETERGALYYDGYDD